MPDPYPNPADHPEAQGFLKHIAEHPGDNLGRLIFADWLADNDYHNASAGQRWAAKHGKRPAPANDPVMMGHAGPFRDLYRGGWYRDVDRETAGDEYYNDSRQYRLPHVFYHAGQTPGLFTAGDTSEPAGVTHERDFLHASHHVSWHPETGEPIDPWAEDPNHNRHV